jgi:hypothetical protein
VVVDGHKTLDAERLQRALAIRIVGHLEQKVTQ